MFNVTLSHSSTYHDWNPKNDQLAFVCFSCNEEEFQKPTSLYENALKERSNLEQNIVGIFSKLSKIDFAVKYFRGDFLQCSYTIVIIFIPVGVLPWLVKLPSFLRY